MRTRAIRAGLLLLLVAGVTGCAPCATVYHIRGTADPRTSYNILFMGSGFKRAELPAYRQAVQEYAERVLATPALSAYQKAVNVYRIDLISGPVDRTRCPTNCAGGSIRPGASNTALGTPLHSLFGRKDVATIDLQSRQCWTATAFEGGNCWIAWLDPQGQLRALDQSFCAPNISAVVVVANTDAVAGGGREDALSAGVGLAVVGAPAAGAADGSLIGDRAVALLEHELGHVLGLYDEYTGATGAALGTFHHGRNVWRPDAPTLDECAAWEWEPGSPLEPPIPWQCEMNGSCRNGLQVCTKAEEPSDGYCPWRPDEWPSSLAASQEGLGNYCATGSQVEVPPGLWEGAYYRSSCYYRARERCRMRLLDPDAAMCEACTRQARRVLCQFGPPWTACPTACDASPAEAE